MTRYIITGAAGSLGSRLVARLSKNRDNLIRAYDIDEYGLSQLPRSCRRIYGSITDREKLTRAAEGCDVLIHCAAMKNLDISEYNIDSLVATNITGTANSASAAHDSNVGIAIFLSSDKAVTGSSVYGATKFIGEHLWNQAHRMTANTKFLILRSGNFCYSKGSVFEVWKRQNEQGLPLTLTHPEMTRYFISIETVVDIITEMVYNTWDGLLTGGETIVPVMKEYRIEDILKKIYPDSSIKIMGMREGESLYEKLNFENEDIIHKNERYLVIKTKKYKKWS